MLKKILKAKKRKIPKQFHIPLKKAIWVEKMNCVSLNDNIELTMLQ